MMIAVCAASDRKYKQFYQNCQECAELEAMNEAVNRRLKEQEMRAMIDALTQILKGYENK